LEYVQSYMLDNQQRQGRNQENREVVVRDIRAIQQEHQQMLQRAEGHEGGIVEFLNQIINLINAPIQFNDDIEIDEFIGLSGPLSNLFWKAIFALKCCAGFLGLIALLPKTLGTLIFIGMQKAHFIYTNAGNWTELTETALEDTPDRSKGNEAICLMLGYVFLAGASTIWAILSFVCSKWRNNEHSALSYLVGLLATFSKVTVLLSIEALVFPLMAGYSLDFCVFTLIHNDVNFISYTWQHFGSSPIISIFIHYSIGLIYMLHFAYTVSGLREILREGTLWFFRDPNDPDWDPLKDVIEHSIWRHVCRIAISVVIYNFILLILFYIPAQLCRMWFPSFAPFLIGFGISEPDTTHDMFVLQLILPAILDRHRTFRVLQRGMKEWIKMVSKLLSLDSFLLPPPPNTPSDQDIITYPSMFRFRVSFILYFCCEAA